MGSQPRLKYRGVAETDREATGGVRRSALTDSYKLERRGERRRGAEGSVSASYSNGRDRFGITHLEMVDRSASGLGVRTRVRIEPGEIVTICPEGSTVAWVRALAVRCVERGDEFEVGLRYARGGAA